MLPAVQPWFEENFTSRGEVGAAVSIWQHGREILSLQGGTLQTDGSSAWKIDTLVPVWSATKGPAAVSCLLALHEAEIALHEPVASIWPEFSTAGKGAITFAQLLSHRAGLCALDQRASVLDHAEVVRAIEAQAPLWQPGTQQAYHARTFGFLLDEVVRRITGASSLGQYFRSRIGDPMDLDFWIGLPTEHHHRVATLYPGKFRPGAGEPAFLKAFSTPGSITQRTFASPAGLHAISDLNRPESWLLGNASLGGVGSARGLGMFYAMLAAGGVWSGRQIVPQEVVAVLQQPLSQAEDAVLCLPIAFSAGMMMDPVSDGKLRSHYGPSLRAFGHPGAGGSLAFADPEHGLAFAYVMNQMELGVLPGPKSLGMVERLYADVFSS